MEIGIETIKKMREETGLSISKCKEALIESNGDIEKARNILKEKGSLASAKKADRELNAGVVQSYIHNDASMGTLIELLCETDFVSKNEEFKELAKNIAIHTAAFNPLYKSREDIEKDKLEELKNELSEDIDKSKPKDMQEKILEGKLDSKLKEVVLLEQVYLKDETKTIQDLCNEAVQKFGERVEIGRFIVWKI